MSSKWDCKQGVKMLLSFCPAFLFQTEKSYGVDSVECKMKPGKIQPLAILSALEKSYLWMPLAQVWRVSIAAPKPCMGCTPGSS